MSSFGAWLWRNQQSGPDAARVFAVATAAAAAWPVDGSSKGQYQSIIRQQTTGQTQTDALTSLDVLWPLYQADVGRERPSVGDTLLANIPTFIIFVVVVLVIFWAGSSLTTNLLRELASLEIARGLITFLFALATVGVAIITIVNSFLSSAKQEEHAERFRQGKDILTVLIGVFGTIVGFYFGQGDPQQQSQRGTDQTRLEQQQQQQQRRPGAAQQQPGGNGEQAQQLTPPDAAGPQPEVQ